MKLLDIYSKFSDDIHYIENKLQESVRSEDAQLNDAALHLLKAGGKRLRPVFVLLAGRFGKYDVELLSHVAVSLELIHMATLVHDDVIDDAAMRRGQLTVKEKWDERIAMYTGDYILAKALTVVTKLDRPDIHRILSHAVVQMVIGEMEQLRLFYNVEQSVRDYLLRIRRKTALLIAVSCQLGALAADAPKIVTQRLYSFGYNVGMAFQIQDDLLDLTGTAEQLGKPPGSDIRQGNVTLPVLYAIQDERISDTVRRALESLRGASADDSLVDEALTLIRGSAGIREAERLAAKYIDKALAALEDVPDIPEKEDLAVLARFITNRTY
ncbi:polyprenyl synthetase family protein [Paenibacillus alkalitolerans]|uniref:polyprenyl synthetase family protein n=1 Tax=Paenibacillus alkalitolerans TaxID=2799335 RepID=UPI0018F5B18C|nr:polyprenyl synthetase family protein [Paenibacillus alkalitolerans]